LVIADLMLLSAITFTTDYYMMVLLIFLLGSLTTIRVSVGYLYLVEFFKYSEIAYIGSLISFYQGIAIIFMAVYFWKISKDWIYYHYVTIALQIYGTITTFFVPESPKWLIETGNHEDLFTILSDIAKSNGTKYTKG